MLPWPTGGVFNLTIPITAMDSLFDGLVQRILLLGRRDGIVPELDDSKIWG